MGWRKFEMDALGALTIFGVGGVVLGMGQLLTDGKPWYLLAGVVALVLVPGALFAQALRTYHARRRLTRSVESESAQGWLRNLAYSLDTRMRREPAGSHARDELRAQTDVLLAAADVAEAGNADADRYTTDAKLRALYVVVLEWAQIASMRPQDDRR